MKALENSLENIHGYELTAADFKRVQKLIYNHAGITLSDTRQDMVYSRVIRRLRATGLASFQDYLALIESNSAEWEAFVNSMTTNLTAFFRERYHFPILEQLLLAQPNRKLRIWCNAASTGEEPYSLAITAMRAFNSTRPPVEIIATDIDTRVLESAAQGVYRADSIDNMPFDLSPYFLRGKASNSGFIKVKPEVQKLVTFKPLNLMDASWPLDGQFDAIFCRNVLIYFDKDTQRRVLSHIRPLMADHALLFVGHSESLLHLNDLFRLRGKTVYEKQATHTARVMVAPGV